MKTKYGVFVVLLALIVSCKEEISVMPEHDAVEKIIPQPRHLLLESICDEPMTRTLIDDNQVYWLPDDTIGVFCAINLQKDNVPFYLKSMSEDNRKAYWESLDTLSWLQAGDRKTLFAYYPYRTSLSENLEFLVDSLQIQQDAKGTHIGDLDYMISAATEWREELPKLHFRHLMALMDIHLVNSGKDSLVIENVSLQAPTAVFPLKGGLSPFGNDTLFTVTTDFCSRVAVGLSGDFTLLAPDSALTARLMLIPVDLSGQEIDIVVGTSAGKIRFKKSGLNFMARRRYKTTLNIGQNTPIEIEKDYLNIPSAGGDVPVPVNTDAKVEIEIPDSCASWIALGNIPAPQQDNNILFLSVTENNTGNYRTGTVRVKNAGSNEGQVIRIYQGYGNQICLWNNEGELASQCRELIDTLITTEGIKIYGTLSTEDYLVMRDSMPALKQVDLYDLQSNAVPTDAFSGCKTLQKIILPKELVSIGKKAFYTCSNLSDFDFPPTLITIGNEAFRECTQLTNLYFPESLQFLGSQAFWGCKKIETVYCNDNLETLPTNVFSQCTALTNVRLNKQLKNIEGGAFHTCTNLSGNLELPEGLLTIGSYAFNGCKNLTGDLVLPESLIKLVGGAFCGCSGFTSLEIKSVGLTKIGYEAFSGCSGFRSVTFSDGIKEIEKFAFSNCSNWTGALVLPDSLQVLGEQTFIGCAGLTSVTFNKILKDIGQSCFSSCSGLSGILVLPDSLTAIQRGAFQNCSELSGIAFNQKLVSIAYYAFANCTGLNGKLVFPPNLESIGSSRVSAFGAFYGCTGLTEIVLNDKLASIGDYAFFKCTGLTGKLVLPASLKILNGHAFRETGYTAVQIKATEIPESSADPFYETDKTVMTLYVPEASIGNYTNADYWKDFGTIIGE